MTRDLTMEFSAHPSQNPAVRGILIVTAAAFFLQSILGAPMERLCGLVPGLAVSRLFLWQFTTYLFLHAGVVHLLFNMFMLWMFGRDVETALGSRRFVFFYLLCGAGAGLCACLFYGPSTVIMGASGAIFAVMVAFAMLFPDRLVTLLVFFVLPVTMKARYLVMIFAGIEILFIVGNVEGDFVAHAAHLGGALFGYAYIRYMRGRRPRARHAGDDGDETHEQIDRILERISRHGMSGLTEGEKELLRKASEKLRHG